MGFRMQSQLLHPNPAINTGQRNLREKKSQGGWRLHNNSTITTLSLPTAVLLNLYLNPPQPKKRSHSATQRSLKPRMRPALGLKI